MNVSNILQKQLKEIMIKGFKIVELYSLGEVDITADEDVNNDNYDMNVIMLPKEFHIDFFKRYENNLNGFEAKQEAFKDAYTMLEESTDGLIEYVKKYMTGLTEEEMKEIKVNSDGYVDIYRGSNSLSTDIDNCFSWTTDYDVAKWFAKRNTDESYISIKENIGCKFNQYKTKVKRTKFFKGDIHHARAKLSDILHYYDGRNEKEVIVLPNNITYIKTEKI